MKRIDGLDRALDLFGPGMDGFREQVPGVSLATQLNAKWFNHVQESLVRTIEAADIELSEADFDQFTVAVRSLAALAAANKVTQGGGIGQLPGSVSIGAAVGGKLKATVNAADRGAFAFEEWVLARIGELAQTVTNELDSKESAFATGTRMLFAQTSAPLGWTKVLDHDNAALRVVSGAAGSGGSLVFTTAFAANRNVSDTVLTIDQMPAHTHDGPIYSNLLRPPYVGSLTGTDTSGSGAEQPVGGDDGGPMQSVGGGQGHSHTINFDVRYVDVIIASKD